MTQAAIKLLLLGGSGGWALADLFNGRSDAFSIQVMITVAIFFFVQPRPFSA